MCESNAYMKNGDEEELLLSEVAVVEPVPGGFRLVGLFGDELTVTGRLSGINLLKHKIIFEKDG